MSGPPTPTERSNPARRADSASERMEAVGTLASAVAHEFNNLLTVVLANMEPLETGADARDLRRIQRATDAVHRAARLTHQMLAFAHPPEETEQDADLVMVLHGIDALLAQLAGRGIPLEIVSPKHRVTARVNVGRLELMLLDVVCAIKAARPHGQAIRLELAHADGRAQLAISAREGWDAGPGRAALDQFAALSSTAVSVQACPGDDSTTATLHFQPAPARPAA